MDTRNASPAQRRFGRRDLLRVGASVAALSVLPRGIAAAAAGAQGPSPLPSLNAPANGSRPNIIFINTDDLDAASMTYMPKVKSLLTDQGTSFSNFFLNVSLCCPSRTTFLRGQYAHNTQVLTNGGTNGGYARAHALGLEQSTIATWLQAAGYHTGQMGKYLNGYRKDDTAVPPGWNEWYGSDDGYPEFNYRLNENGTIVQYGNKPEDYLTDVLAGKATDFITRAAGGTQPFFLYIATFAPHNPATPAPRYADAFPGAKAPRPPSYNEADVSDKPQWVKRLPLLDAKRQTDIDDHYRMRIQSLQAVDDLVERVVNASRMAGTLDNTYIVFSSDNGFHLGQHREATGKQAPYEEDIRVPLIVRGPGVAAGKSVDALTGNVDYAPTFAAWAGATVPDFVDGRSFAPLLTDGVAPAWRTAFMIEHYAEAGGAAQQQPRQRVAATPAAPMPQIGRGGIPEFHGMRTQQYVYVEYTTNERELYDLTKDPDQLQNSAGTANPALLMQLSARLADLNKGKGAALRAVEEQSVPALA